MADNDEMNPEINDEYQFTELDPLNPSVTEEDQGASDATEEPRAKRIVGDSGNHIKRNAIIAVIVFVGVMFGYKLIGSYFLGTKTEISEIKPVITAPTPAPSPAPSPAPIEPVSVVETPQPLPAPSEPSSPEIKSNLSSLVLGQEHLNTKIATFSDQMDSMQSKMNILTDKMAELNQTLVSLNDKLDSQSQTIERLSAKRVAAPVVRHRDRAERRVIRYYIQAVIPGRAWLVAENGSTLTVREGSRIPGYGLVKLIDPNQGRVMTSSGLVIRFSQNDS